MKKWFSCLGCSSEQPENVTTLDYSGQSLHEVPASIFGFERTLQNLYLDTNKITELPPTLFQCEELRVLDLSQNEIQTIPPSIIKLTNLEQLNLNRNYLTPESLPSTIHKCQKIKCLHLSSNLMKKVPEALTSVVSLLELYLSDNEIEYLPANFGRLHKLRVLELRNNNLISLPKSLKRLTEIQRLDISSNAIEKFPDVIGHMVGLKELWISDNNLTSIDRCIGNLQKLKHFDASNNDITTISSNIQLCQHISLLILSKNCLVEIPHEITRLTELQTLKLDENLLEQLPETMGMLTNLEELNVQHNHLKSMPSSLGMLRKLKSLVASYNLLSDVPPEIGSCSSLTILTLHCNMLKNLPEEIGHLQQLTSINLVNNRLRYLPITVLDLGSLKALWVSQNQIHPLIALHRETIGNNQYVLSCVFLPQTPFEAFIDVQTEPSLPKTSTSRRHIDFADSDQTKDTPTRLNRIPTPHPKSLLKYQRSFDKNMRRFQEQSDDIPRIKLARVAAMRNNLNDEPSTSQPFSEEPSTSINQSSLAASGNFRIVEPHNVASKFFLSSSSNSRDKINQLPDILLTNFHSQSQLTYQSGDLPGSVYTDDTDSERKIAICQDEVDNNYLDDSRSSGATAMEDSNANSNLDENCNPDQAQRVFSNTDSSNMNFPVDTLQHTIEQIDSHAAKYEKCENTILPSDYQYIMTRLKRIVSEFYHWESSVLAYEVCDDSTFNMPCLPTDPDTSTSQKQPRQPPPYHIAATYSKNANLFNPTLRTERVMTEDMPKHFTQVQPDNILMPQPQHPLRSGQPVQQNYLENDEEVLERATSIIRTLHYIYTTSSYSKQYFDLFKALCEASYRMLYSKTNPDNSTIKYQLLSGKPVFSRQQIKKAFACLYQMVCTMTKCESDIKSYRSVIEKFTEELESIVKNPTLIDKIKTNTVRIEESNVPSTNEQATQCDHFGKQKWIFGNHHDSEVVEVNLIPSVTEDLGFSLSYSEEGVTIYEVNENARTSDKLFPGDRIMMLDGTDLTCMNQEDQIDHIMKFGPKAEKFLISRD